MNRFLLITLFLVVAALQYFYLKPSVTIEPKNIDTVVDDSIRTVSITLTGDLMCHSTQFNYAHVKDDSFDFRGVFREVKKYLSSSDITIGNFETVLGGKEKRYSGYPFFNAPDDFLYAIKDAGLNFLVTANNHALDQGEKGIRRTIEKLGGSGINHTGTFLSERDRDSIRIIDVNDIKIAIVAYSYSTNGVTIPKRKNYLINLIDYKLIKKDIRKARETGADIILVFYHFGDEYEREPNAFQKEVVNETIRLGADIIIGSHPHVVQPVDYFATNSGSLDTGFVAYSLGNFVSNQRWRFSDSGIILKIELTKNLNKNHIKISKVNFIPTWVFRGQIKEKKAHIILPTNIDRKSVV